MEKMSSLAAYLWMRNWVAACTPHRLLGQTRTNPHTQKWELDLVLHGSPSTADTQLPAHLPLQQEAALKRHSYFFIPMGLIEMLRLRATQAPNSHGFTMKSMLIKWVKATESLGAMYQL